MKTAFVMFDDRLNRFFIVGFFLSSRTYCLIIYLVWEIYAEPDIETFTLGLSLPFFPGQVSS